MASSKVLASSNSRNSDLSRRSSSASSSAVRKQPKPDHNAKPSQQLGSMTVDGFLRNVYDTTPAAAESTLLDAQITLIDPTPITSVSAAAAAANDINSGSIGSSNASKTVDEVWREIVSGERKECKEEEPDMVMTLEDFLLAKTGAASVEEEDVKSLPAPLTERLSGGLFAFDPIPPSQLQALDNIEGSIIGFGNGVEVIGGGGGAGGRGKRGRNVLEPLDKAAQQARSRERKQAYQVELESLAVRLEEENERLLKEKAERTKERFKQLMEKVIPIEEKRRPPRVLRKVRSLQW
ncbi:LOW QUALITY PROTEIN: Basic-leucine zipper transcription factor [Trema orientale]|uniref:Basic-leucine zipper transcription factor n=1 Tax=Trema orientale TaxID=63057 RepID=A0A2P5EBV4_TREOI|nr:LOW QUALITY PROTEIN: Basic-leucine zipper transcription factor [Trema orientale]